MIALVMAAVFAAPSPTSSPAPALPALSAQYDVDSYAFHAARAFEFPSSSILKSVLVAADVADYYRPVESYDRRDAGLTLSVTTKSRFNVALTSGTKYLLGDGGALRPAAQNGVALTWDYGTATPATLSFNSGKFGPGRLNSWSASSAQRIAKRVLLTLEADASVQNLPDGRRHEQLLERATLAYRLGERSSLALAAGHASGVAPYLDSVQLYQNAWNVAAAYRQKVRNGELVVTYGDWSTYSNVRGVAIKLVRYATGDGPG